MPPPTCRSGIHGNKHQSVDLWKRRSSRGILYVIHKRATFLINPDPLLLFNCVFVVFWMQENQDFRSSSTKNPNSTNCCPHTSDEDVVLQDSECVNTGDPPAGKQWRVCIVMIEWGGNVITITTDLYFYAQELLHPGNWKPLITRLTRPQAKNGPKH